MRLAFGHCFNVRHFFDNFKLKRVKDIDPDTVRKYYPDGSKRDFCGAIFKRCVEMVVDDMIEHNTQFYLPGIGKATSYLQIEGISGEEFKKIYKRGKWQDIDFVASFFTGHLMYFYISTGKAATRKKTVYLGGALRKRLVEKTNEGFQY